MIAGTVKPNACGYRGALKDGKRVLWACDHVHWNRDTGSRSAGNSAYECAVVAKKQFELDMEVEGKFTSGHGGFI